MERAHLTPAFGRDYKSKREVEASLLRGEDWYLHYYAGRGGYANLETLATMGATEANVRYQRQTKVHVVNVTKLWERHLAGDKGDVTPKPRKPRAPKPKSATQKMLDDLFGG